MGARSQLKLIDDKFTSEHGGTLGVGKRKVRRPFSSKKAMHVVLRARYSVLRYRGHLPMVRHLVRETAERFAIKVYKLGIERNHLHLVTRAERREDLANFLRTLAGQIAQRILKATRGNAFGKFRELPPFTRIVEWGKALQIAKAYVLQNELEASGVIPYTPRTRVARTTFPSRAIPYGNNFQGSKKSGR